MTGSLVAATIWPATLYAALVLVIAAVILVLSHVLGERQRHGPETEQYESGIKPAGPLPRRLSVEFYQIALFFVIFDLEAVFIFSWAVSARRLGWAGYFELLTFVILLFAGLVYLWKTGALDWGASGRRRKAAKAAARRGMADRSGPVGEVARAAADAAAGGGAGDPSGSAP